MDLPGRMWTLSPEFWGLGAGAGQGRHILLACLGDLKVCVYTRVCVNARGDKTVVFNSKRSTKTADGPACTNPHGGGTLCRSADKAGEAFTRQLRGRFPSKV